MEHALVTEAANAPVAPGQAAFFDLDRTLVHGFTAGAFLRERLQSRKVGVGNAARVLKDLASFEAGRLGFSSFLVRAAELYAGMPEAELEAIGERLFRKAIAGHIYPESYALVAAHRAAGRPVVVVTSATRYQAMPVVRALGADHLLCSKLEVEDGMLTGRVERPTCFGVGKRRAAEELASKHDLDVGASWFYTDGIEDLPLLEAVGQPRPLNPHRRLAREARKRGWHTYDFGSRGARPTHMARTALGIGTVVASAGAGLPLLLASGDLDRARNFTKRLVGDVVTRAAGLDVVVDGESHLWSDRPCVFVFNHQSAIEPILLCKILRKDFVGIGKAELKNSVFRPLFDYAGAVYIERFDKDKALAALAPVVETLKSGTCIIMAPEGTRSSTPYPGPFKKGAFHIARQAGVPIVPIVFHNSLDALPKKGRVVHPADVKVTVLPPFWVQDGAVGPQAESLRDQYLITLGYPPEATDDASSES